MTKTESRTRTLLRRDVARSTGMTAAQASAGGSVWETDAVGQ
ncbi:hypothetical protein [Streptomyces niveus]